MATSDEALQEKRNKLAELRDAIRKARAERERHARETQNDVEAQALDAEINRLERVLEEERALTDHQLAAGGEVEARAESPSAVVVTPPIEGAATGDEQQPTEPAEPAEPAKGAANDKKKKEN